MVKRQGAVCLTLTASGVQGARRAVMSRRPCAKGAPHGLMCTVGAVGATDAMQRLVQLALDFFDPLVAPSGPSAHGPSAGRGSGADGQPDSEQKRAVALIPPAPVAPESIAIKPPALKPVALPSLLAPAEFRHPQASRELLLGDALVAYALQRVRRRSIGFTVGADGLSVRAPTWVTLAAVDAALREKSGWIVRKLGEARERQQTQEGSRIVWTDGAVLPYLGEPLQLVLDPGHRCASKGGALVVPAAQAARAMRDDAHPVRSACSVGADEAQGVIPSGLGAEIRSLHIALPHSASPAQIRDAVQAWLMRDAHRHFTARLDHFAPLLGVRWASLRLSSAQTRWGSAKADGSIRLNWRLLHYRPAVIDYVVAHELAHLRVMNHSPQFWSTVATVVPEYRQLRGELREKPAPLWD